ncbi:unnamed protein product [Durusdinium trenchii]|uniref:Uncharacterized protein n=1 Tax=Durusdinium trenchii TaxID=1381693 RepID=A0ABP0SIM2_9DINO
MAIFEFLHRSERQTLAPGRIEDVAASSRFWASKCGMAFRRPVKKTTLWKSPNNFGLAFNAQIISKLKWGVTTSASRLRVTCNAEQKCVSLSRRDHSANRANPHHELQLFLISDTPRV